MLDALVPHQILGLMPELNVYSFARTTEPFTSDTGMKLIADYDLESVPQPDILAVGGMGSGSPEKASPELIEYVRQWVAPLQEGLDEFVAKANIPA